MAISKRSPTSIPGLLAGADLSVVTGGRFLTVDATGRAVLTAAAGRIDCALEADANPALDQAVSNMGPGAVAKIEASAAIAAGAPVGSAANGQARTAVGGDFVAGVALNAAGAVGEVVSVFLSFPGRQP